MLPYLSALLLLSLSPALHAAPKDGKKIVGKALKNDEGFGDSVVEAEMILSDAQGVSSKRTFSIKTLEGENDEDKTVILFQTPKDIEGTALLTHTLKDDDNLQWLYLPAVRRVKRISSSNQSGPFVGSEFAYEDMVTHVLGKYDYKYLRTEPFNKLSCDVIEEKPKNLKSGYSKQVVWLDEKELRIQKVEFYDKKNEKFKTLLISDYKKFKNKFWRPATSKMENHQTGKSTLINWKNYKFKTGLKASDFNKSVLKQAR